MAGASTESRSAAAEGGPFGWGGGSPRQTPHERRVIVFDCEVLTDLVYSFTATVFFSQCGGRDECPSGASTAPTGVRVSLEEYSFLGDEFWKIVSAVSAMPGSTVGTCSCVILRKLLENFIHFLHEGGLGILRSVFVLLSELYFYCTRSCFQRSKSKQQLVNLGCNSDCVNVHVGASWKALNVKARSPGKVMDVIDLVSMTLCPAAWRSKRTT